MDVKIIDMIAKIIYFFISNTSINNFIANPCIKYTSNEILPKTIKTLFSLILFIILINTNEKQFAKIILHISLIILKVVAVLLNDAINKIALKKLDKYKYLFFPLYLKLLKKFPIKNDRVEIYHHISIFNNSKINTNEIINDDKVNILFSKKYN